MQGLPGFDAWKTTAPEEDAPDDPEVAEDAAEAAYLDHVDRLIDEAKEREADHG